MLARLIGECRGWSTLPGLRRLSNFRRSIMYVPASDERKLARVGSLAADCIVLDCEDGVSDDRKDVARQNVVKLLRQHRQQRLCTAELGWRMNSASSGLMEEDLKAVSEGGHWPDSIMLPKVNCVADLKLFYHLSHKHMASIQHLMSLVVWIESAEALMNMNHLLTTAANCCIHSPMIVDGAVFGSDDYCADVGVTRTNHATEILYPRQRFVLMCKAHRLQPIDIVFTDIGNLDGLREQCIEGRNMGFTGKQVIHPSQLPVVQEVFMPSQESYLEAKQLLNVFEQQQQGGVGAIRYRGNMVDKPIMLQAKRVVSMFEQLQRH